MTLGNLAHRQALVALMQKERIDSFLTAKKVGYSWLEN